MINLRLIFFGLVVGFFFLFVSKYMAEKNLVITNSKSESPSQVPIIEARNKKALPGAPVAFLVHGYQCNKSMMIQLAKFLALNGVNTYAIDLPGHGASKEPFSEKRIYEVADEALLYLLKRDQLREDQVILIGHSFGAAVVGRIGCADGRFAASIYLGPGHVKGTSEFFPKNLLILTGGNDYEFVIDNAQKIISDATNFEVSSPEKKWGGSLNRESRLWHVIQGLGHVGLIYSPKAFGDVLNWIEFSTGFRTLKTRFPSSLISAGAFAMVIGLVIIFATLIFSRPTRMDPEQGHRDVSLTKSFLILAYSLCGAIFLSFVLNCGNFSAKPLSYFTPLHFLRIQEGEIIASFLFTIGFLACLFDVVFCRGTHLPRIKDLVRGIPLSFSAIGVLYILSNFFITREFFHLSLEWSTDRILALLILGVSLFPFFTICGRILDDFKNKIGTNLKGEVLAFFSGCLLYGILAASLNLVGYRLGRFGAAFFLLGVFTLCFGLLVKKFSANTHAGALFSTIFSAWIIAVSFIRY